MSIRGIRAFRVLQYLLVSLSAACGTADRNDRLPYRTVIDTRR